ncbi:hypothetical protein JNM87_01930 [Candidatus Saccharibacteria bacterium]|nr:hypothetical protein [Candidatus Saccharibacteria bacterium]
MENEWDIFDQPSTDEPAATAAPPDEITLDEVANTLSLTIKDDHENKLIAFLCMLSAYTDNSQLNVSFNAPSSSGKTYLATEIAKLFPAEDKIERSGASPTSFFYSEGVYDKKRKLRVVSLERKILLFYEQPNPQLQERLRAVLSHDQRELFYSNTNKDKKGSNRAEQTVIRGYPATVFCSAGLKLDEQEATRAILLSPEISENKLKQGVYLQAMRGANEIQFDEKLESNPARIALKKRIIAIRDEQVNDIMINDPSEVLERFHRTFKKLKPRHMRDMGHLMRLIKVVALLNVWHRRTDDGAIVASQDDVEQAFKLWSKVIETQDLNVPPTVMLFYKTYILPAYAQKAKDPDSAAAMRENQIGISGQELSDYHWLTEESPLNEDHLRKQVLPQLINSGMIAYEQPQSGDRRSKHIFPKYFPDGKNDLFNDNYIGRGGGDIPQEVMDLFFNGAKDK